MTNLKDEYFYCYSSNLFRFLKMVKKINYICTGLHQKSFKQFWQFKSDEKLLHALAEYREIGNEMGVIR